MTFGSPLGRLQVAQAIACVVHKHSELATTPESSRHPEEFAFTRVIRDWAFGSRRDEEW
jgi:hypothetical protein